jgi:hypothetical protein
MASGGQRARPVGERHVDGPGSPLTSCTGANTRGARTPGRGPALVCVYDDVRRWADVAEHDVARAARARGPAPKPFGIALFECEFLQTYQLKCTKG